MMKSIFSDLWNSFKRMSVLLLVLGIMIGLSYFYKDAEAKTKIASDIQLEKWNDCYDRCADKWDKMIEACLSDGYDLGECFDRYEKQWDKCNDQCDLDYPV